MHFSNENHPGVILKTQSGTVHTRGTSDVTLRSFAMPNSAKKHEIRMREMILTHKPDDDLKRRLSELFGEWNIKWQSAPRRGVKRNSKTEGRRGANGH